MSIEIEDINDFNKQRQRDNWVIFDPNYNPKPTLEDMRKELNNHVTVQMVFNHHSNKELADLIKSLHPDNNKNFITAIKTELDRRNQADESLVVAGKKKKYDIKI